MITEHTVCDIDQIEEKVYRFATEQGLPDDPETHAACRYLASSFVGQRETQADVAKRYECSTSKVRKRFREINMLKCLETIL